MITSATPFPAQAAELPQYIRDHSRWIIEIPVRILVIVLVALLVRAVLHRFINRLVRPVRAGDVPRVLRPFKERVQSSAIFASTGLLSERREQRAATIASVLRSVVSFTLLLIAALLILSELNIDLAPFIAGTSIVGVAVAFGAQNIVKDFLAGMFMMFEDQYGVGDVIDFEKATGTVEAVGLRTTRLRDDDGTVWYVRNGEVVRVGNQSQGFAQVNIDVPIAASANVASTQQTVLNVAQELRHDQKWAPLFLGEPQMLGVESIGLDQTVIRLAVRVRSNDQWRVARELRARIHDQLQ